MSDMGRLKVNWGTEMSPSREQNQDAVRIYQEQRQVAESRRGMMLALADGMGGHRGGADAAQMAVDQMWLFYQLPARVFNARKTLHELFERANQSLRKMGEESEQHRRMGSTLSILLFDHSVEHFLAMHVGDSPIFQFRDGHVRALSREHVSADSQRLTQRLGQKGLVEPHVTTGKVVTGDRFVLLSDGIWTVEERESWLEGMSAHHSASAIVESLMEKVRLQGKDNGTIIVADVEESPEAP